MFARSGPSSRVAERRTALRLPVAAACGVLLAGQRDAGRVQGYTMVTAEI